MKPSPKALRRRRNLSRILSQSVKDLAGPSLKKMIPRKPSPRKRLKRKKRRRQFKSSKSRLQSMTSRHRKKPPKNLKEMKRSQLLKKLRLQMRQKRRKRKKRVMEIVSDPPVSEAKGAVAEEVVIGVVNSEKAKEAVVNVAEAEAVVDEAASATKTAKMKMDLPLSVSASKTAEDVALEVTEGEVEARIEAARHALLETAIVQRKMLRLQLKQRRTTVTN